MEMVMGKETGSAPSGLDAAYGEAPGVDRKETGDPDAPAAAATDTLGELVLNEARAREQQAKGQNGDAGGGPDEDDEGERRKRAYAIWEKEGRPEDRHEEHWHAAGDAEAPEPGTAPWTEGP
jgi:hypothetical protein